jgi:Ca2+-binding RTX toxin-like protein
VLQGSGNLAGTGNALANNIYGNSGNNTLDGGVGADVLQGSAGNDTFVFNANQADGDMVLDFAGMGAATGDSLRFVGFGTIAQGARDRHHQPVADPLRPRRAQRDHHVCQRRVDRPKRLDFHMRSRARGLRSSG